MNRTFWRGRRVFVTGHTGFKGSWLTLWLTLAGAKVTGYSLAPPTQPNLFEAARVGEGIASIRGDVVDRRAVRDALQLARPDVVFHLAAQPLVRASLTDPVETYATNVMGTAHVLDALGDVATVRVIVIVTSDKCYDARRDGMPFSEHDPLGGPDPYSSSKACAELVAAAWRQSFFDHPGAPRLITVRAGNVVGGGDWAVDRLVPDLVRAFAAGHSAVVRYPDATRPWQFVLDALQGYLRVAEAVFDDAGLPHAWNFGPAPGDARTVRWVADRLAELWGDHASWHGDGAGHPVEAACLTLDSSRARTQLGWAPRLDVASALAWTADWYRTWVTDPARAREATIAQIDAFELTPG